MSEFIVFEGINGSGKTTALRAVAERRKREGREVVTLCNPSQGLVGMELRKLVATQRERGFPMFFSSGPATLDFATQLAVLFVADRIAMQPEIEAAIKAGKDVLCDRYSLSTLLYQCAMIGDISLRSDLAKAIGTMHAGLRAPDTTVIFDLPVEMARERLRTRGERVDDTMMATIDPAVRAMYASVHHLNGDDDGNDRYVPTGFIERIDATQSPEEVADAVYKACQGIPW